MDPSLAGPDVATMNAMGVYGTNDPNVNNFNNMVAWQQLNDLNDDTSRGRAQCNSTGDVLRALGLLVVVAIIVIAAINMFLTHPSVHFPPGV